jgi:uncharacterized protein YegL
MSLLEKTEFAENPDQRCPCVLVLDTSQSMAGPRIDELNAGLRVLKETLASDSTAMRRVEIAVVTFDSAVKVVQDFVTAEKFDPPTLTAQNLTCMGAGIKQGLDLIEARKETYRRNGVPYYRPWLFVITDGEPQGEPAEVIEETKRRIRADATDKRATIYAVGVGDQANLPRLEEITGTKAMRLKGLSFKELFQWLSASMSKVSKSAEGAQVALPPTNNFLSVEA